MISRAAQYGGTVVYPAHTAAIALNAHSKRMHVVIAAGNLNFTLPDARLFKIGGPHFVIGNGGSGGFTVTVKDAAGTTLTTLADGAAVKMSLQANGTSAGTWIFDARSFTAVGTAKPSYSIVFGERETTGSTSDRNTRLDHVSATITDSSDSGTAQQDFDRHAVWDLGGTAHASARAGSATKLHLEYVLDTWTTRSQFTPGTSLTDNDGPEASLVYSGEAVQFFEPRTDIWEWDITDTWTELAGNWGNSVNDNLSSNGVAGPVAGEMFFVGANFSASFTTDSEAYRLWSRITETSAAFAPNINVQLQHGGGAWKGSASMLRIVGGSHARGTSFSDCDAQQFAYDMTGGLLGAWSIAPSHPNGNVPGPGAYHHPTIATRGVLMSGSVGTAVTDFSRGVWYWDDDTIAFTQVGSLAAGTSRARCWANSCHLTNS